MIEHDQMKKLDKCSDRQFISPRANTVKKGQLIKMKIDSKQISKCIHRSKYQMTTIEPLLAKTAQAVKTPGQVDIFFSMIDLRYAYAQLSLNYKTKEQCNFSLVGGRATDLYQF